MLVVFSLSLLATVEGQSIGGVFRRRGQGRREGGIRLPTPPFNPNAGVLRSPKGDNRDAPKTTTRRSTKRRTNASKRSPRPTPRKRRVRRVRHRHRG
ncbi:MAG TPA: hypothetical protein VNA19_00620 [Pyrinomonadaceae bacterium]|nr:hypothetical protein [Pyrinomonadaceae bacterium]